VGEFGDLHPAEFSLRSVLGLVYLVTFGSWLAFTAYAWLLQNAPLSKVATYAYVNPVVAIALGWALLDEAVTSLTFAGAAVIVTSVAAVVRIETRRSNPR
jgi:drug/metabolite transporter (DMT)-like permease